MRRCVAYIHDPDTTLKYDLKVKFIGFWHVFVSGPYLFFGLILAYHICTWLYHHKMMCHVHSWSRFDVNLWLQCHVFMSDMKVLLALILAYYIKHMGFWPWKMCQVHSWSWYDLERWPKGQIYRVNDMALCSGLSFFSFDVVILCLAECITMVQCVAYIHELCMNLTFGLNIQIIFSHGFESGKMSLLFDIGIPNFGIWVYHHETTCCVHSWPYYDLDFWPLCGWRGVFLVSFTHSFYLVKIARSDWSQISWTQ